MKIIVDGHEYAKSLGNLMAYLLMNYSPVRMVHGDEVGLNNRYFRFDFNLYADDPESPPGFETVFIEGSLEDICHGANVVITHKILEEALARLFEDSWAGYDVKDTPLIKSLWAIK